MSNSEAFVYATRMRCFCSPSHSRRLAFSFHTLVPERATAIDQLGEEADRPWPVLWPS